jgi:hypothetical protein
MRGFASRVRDFSLCSVESVDTAAAAFRGHAAEKFEAVSVQKYPGRFGKARPDVDTGNIRLTAKRTIPIFRAVEFTGSLSVEVGGKCI